MTDGDKTKRLSKVAREFNVGITTIVEFLHKKGITIEVNPNTKIDTHEYSLLLKEYSTDFRLKEESAKLDIGKHRTKQESVSIGSNFEAAHKEDDDNDVVEKEVIIKDNSSHKPIKKDIHAPQMLREDAPIDDMIAKENLKVTIVGKIDLEPKKKEKLIEPEPIVEKVEPIKKVENKIEEKKHEPVKETRSEKIEELVSPASEIESTEIKTKIEQLEDVKVVGMIDLNLLNQKTRPSRKSKEEKTKERQDRESIKGPAETETAPQVSIQKPQEKNFQPD